ncbi:MAG: hypothetical protein DSZ05_07970, partial [Sulfurospirillum sp.]
MKDIRQKSVVALSIFAAIALFVSKCSGDHEEQTVYTYQKDHSVKNVTHLDEGAVNPKTIYLKHGGAETVATNEEKPSSSSTQHKAEVKHEVQNVVQTSHSSADELEKLQADKEALTQQLNQKVTQIGSENQKQQEAQEEIARLKLKITGLTQKIQSLSQQLTQTLNQKTEQIRLLQTEKSKLTSEEALLAKDKQAALQASLEMKKELDALRAKNKALREKEHIIKNLTREKEHAQQDVVKLVAKVKALEAKLSEINTNSTQKTTQVEEKWRQTQRALDEKERQINHLNHVLRSKEREIARLTRETEVLSEKLKHLKEKEQSNFTSLKQKLATTVAALAAIKSQAREKERTLHAFTSDEKALKAALQKLKNENDQLRKSLQVEKEELTKEIDTLKKRLHESSNQLKEKEKLIAQLTKEKEKALASLKTLQQKYKNQTAVLNHKLQELEQNTSGYVHNIKEKLAAATTTQKETAAKVAALEAALNSTKEELEKTKSSKAELETKLSELQQKYQDQTNALNEKLQQLEQNTTGYVSNLKEKLAAAVAALAA